MTVIYKHALEHTAGIVANVKADQLAGPTPCDDFDTRSLLNHLIGGTLLFARAAQGEKMDPSQQPPDFVGQAGDDPAKAFEDARALAVEAWSKPDVVEQLFPVGDGMPGKAALRIALLEAVLHGWDVAKATGQDARIDPMMAQPMLEGLKKVVTDAWRGPGKAFGQQVEVPDDAPIDHQLLAFTGRRP